MFQVSGSSWRHSLRRGQATIRLPSTGPQPYRRRIATSARIVEQQGGEALGEPVAVALPRPAPHAAEQLVELGARQRPDRLERLVLRQSQWAPRGERLHEHPEVREPLAVEALEELRELRVATRR